MPKPTITFDFALGSVAERLPEAAVAAMYERRLPARKLFHELSSYFQAKPLREARPRKVLQIVSRYVNIQPVDFRVMERVCGPAARHALPDSDIIPDILWETQDFMDGLSRDKLGNPMRDEVTHLVNARASVIRYYQVTAKYLAQAGYSTVDVRNYTARVRQSQQGRRPSPA